MLKIHFCKEKYSYNDLSKKCKEFCDLEANHKDNIFVKFQKKDQCEQKCDLKDKSRNCLQKYSLEVAYKGSHLCNIKLEEYLCKYKYYLKSDSKECYQLCNKLHNHTRGVHICSLSEHICKKECSFYVSPGIKLRNECSLRTGA